MKKENLRKLTLKKETISKLHNADLSRVQGGLKKAETQSCRCNGSFDVCSDISVCMEICTGNSEMQ